LLSSRVVVAGPGAPEMRHMAEALAEAGALRAYVAPFSPTRSEIEASPYRNLGPLGRAVLSQLGRRIVSDAVGRSERPGAARVTDIAATAALRLGLAPRLVELFEDWRNRAMQKRLASLLGPADTDLIVPAGAALTPLRRARELAIRSWLDCPTAHHRYAWRLLTEELRLEPDFASTMQYPAASARAGERLDSEIEAADELIVLSSFQARTFEEEGVAGSRLHLVPLGVDVGVFRPLPQSRGGVFTIGFVGQVTQRKGISYLLKAFESLPRRDVRLLVVGRPVGPRKPWTRARVEHRLPVARSSLPKVYAEMDVVVLPSLIEGFGLTALEAMACGIPVIVSENTFGSDIVVDDVNGYVVPIRDAAAIAERIGVLMNDETLRSEMGTNARITAENHSWEAFGRQIVELVTRQQRRGELGGLAAPSPPRGAA
jgi:glycosyltransferase involved in cell wall biosynthesis